MLAIKLEDAKGDITGTDQVIWTMKRLTPYVPSPLLYQGSLYFLRHNQNVLSRLDAATGKPGKGPFRMQGLRTIFSSPVGAAGRIYITDREGVTLVISNGDTPRALALNRLNDHFSASAALAGKEFYLRGEEYLYCIAED
jgi:outer membrane protein assembly factor BamB